MKIVINNCFGSFGISDECTKVLGDIVKSSNLRTNSYFISLVEHDSEWASDQYAELTVVDIPDDVTDWEIENYDGMETVIYVRNGKIHHVDPNAYNDFDE